MHFNIIVDSHAIVRNNAERSHLSPTQVTSRLTSVPKYNQETEVDTIHPLHSDFMSFTHACVCLCVRVHVRVNFMRLNHMHLFM